LLRERANRISQLITLEEGKPLGEARAEVADGADCLEFLGEEARRVYGRVLPRPAGTRALVVKEPVGPVAGFAPWNYPVSNACRKLGAAIAAGCSIILKPAEEAPTSAVEVLKCLLDSGLPKTVAQLVYGDPDHISRHLLASPVIRHVSFTGSVPVGKHLMRLAADTMKRTTMELGGHAPVVVFDDCDLDRTVDLMVSAKYRNAGQICISPTRFFVQEDIYERYVDQYCRRVSSLRVGPGLEPSSQMGPVANSRRIDALEALVEDASRLGARIRSGGERMDGPGFFLQPTVISDVPAEARIMNEEPFGPVAVMTPFRSAEDAIDLANRLTYGLAAYAFTTSAARATMIAGELEAGVVAVNCASIGDADTPFGGVKESGHGSEQGPEGLDAYLVTKSIVQM
jgi:succinate-semialdehyde dehydrogenase/glutarate-semialdehyde dehydrogenase